MHQHLLLLFASLFATTALAQRDSFVAVLSLPVQARCAEADQFGNVYVLTTANALEKYAPDGRLLTRYSNNRLGPAARVDVSNPLKVMPA